MTNPALPAVDITAQWGRLNDTFIALLEHIPDGQMDWSPKPELWNLRGILLHTIMTRDMWLGEVAKDGVQAPHVLETAQTKDGMGQELRRSWERVWSFLGDAEKLAAEYPAWDRANVTGHWIAFHLLEHDIHHRSDVFHYLALLGIDHPSVGTP